MVGNSYFTLLRASSLEFYHQLQFNVNQKKYKNQNKFLIFNVSFQKKINLKDWNQTFSI